MNNLINTKSDLEYLSDWIDLKTDISDSSATMIIEKITDMIKEKKGYKALTQTDKNLAWFLPRPKPDHYKGGMPLYCEEWLVQLAKDLLGYPPSILNVFCGMNKFGLRVDIKPEVKPDVICDAHKLSQFIDDRFDCIIADPPYSDDEAKEIYGTPKLKYKIWTSECDKLLLPGGLLMIYHKYVMPNPNPEKYEVVKRVFIGNRTMHLPRVCIVFRKKH
jgi:16S rRNA G966 N2-methylase RsmD